MLCPTVVDQLTLELQRLDGKYSVRDADDLHDLLRHLGDLTVEELALRCNDQVVRDGRMQAWIEQLLKSRRAIQVRVSGQDRLAAAEDAARLRDALGIVLPPGLPEAFLESSDDALLELIVAFRTISRPLYLRRGGRTVWLGREHRRFGARSTGECRSTFSG